MTTPSAYSLAGRTALITGGGTGIGLAVAKCLAASGAKVILGGRREEPLQTAASEIGELASIQVMDVNDTAAAPVLAATLREKHGPIGILVNNAGINMKKPFTETTEADTLSVFQTNVMGGLALARALHPQLKEAGQGSVVFISSMAAVMGIPLVSAYSVAKSAITGAVRAMAVEWGADGIRVNAVAPGWIDTAMSRRAFEGDPARKQKILTRTALGCLGDTEDVGWSVAYLCSPAAKFVTGTIIPVDGGASMGF